MTVLILIGCSKPAQLTESEARDIITSRMTRRPELIYAEVPQRVWWGPKAPKDDYDEKALRTLRNLEREGLLTVSGGPTSDGGESWQGKVTEKGFPILGTMPSMRGAVFRSLIAKKKFDEVRGFQHHPNDPTIARAEIIWHYGDPTPLYPLFETRIDKELDVPYRTIVSFFWNDYEWTVSITVKKERVPAG